MVYKDKETEECVTLDTIYTYLSATARALRSAAV